MYVRTMHLNTRIFIEQKKYFSYFKIIYDFHTLAYKQHNNDIMCVKNQTHYRNRS